MSMNTSRKVQDLAPPPGKALSRWIAENLTEQETRYGQIVAAMESLSGERDGWISAFLRRINQRGFNQDCDQKRLIAARDLPNKPRRRFRVVF